MSAAPTAPDLVEPVVGFRAWRIVAGRLLSPYIPCRWEGRVMHAGCWPANRTLLRGRGWLAAPHASPHPACQCGVYAYHRPGTQAYYGEWEWVEGVVAAWGRIEAHRDGLRAEHARIEALARPPAHEPGRRASVEAIAARLGCAVVAREDLRDAAAGAGAPLPPSLLPAAGAARTRS
ncbi:MAG TPA: hypothetical protein VLA98_15855 [Solirubrobacteraceae bacterium]|nr:hypothetical protein [Solirubrobacteraceae bacterium]